jgi:hypothetical protein
MTDVLLKPDDTGEIPIAEPGQTTRNLTWITQAPALRRPAATFKTDIVDGGCRTVVPNDEDFESPDELQGPQPKPRPLPAPKPKVDDRPLSPGEEIVWTSTWRPTVRTPGYVGRHRKVSRWDRVRVALAIAWAPIRNAF